MKRSREERNAASVATDPVGAAINAAEGGSFFGGLRGGTTGDTRVEGEGGDRDRPRKRDETDPTGPPDLTDPTLPPRTTPAPISTTPPHTGVPSFLAQARADIRRARTRLPRT